MFHRHQIDFKNLVDQQNRKFEKRFNFFLFVLIIITIITLSVVFYLHFRYQIPFGLIIIVFIKLCFWFFILYRYFLYILYIDQLFKPPFLIRLNLLFVHVLFI